MADEPLAFPTLDRAGIAQRIPHSGSMCLLDRMVHATDTAIHCTTLSHLQADNPLRTASGLLASCAIEYAAQAMALHGALRADPAAEPTPGFLASARSVRLVVLRLDEVAGPLHVHAERTAGDANQALYRFSLRDDQGLLLAEGRAAVVLNTPLAALTGTSSS